ncbi:MAG: phasin family protein [Pseudomonadota bacterium]
MVKKLQKLSAEKKSAPHLSGAVKESAQQIWLAGLGAFSKAQEEGGKVFETLVKEGLSIQRKTQAAAEEKISEATSKMANMATDIQSKAGHQWDKLENIFEDRVAKALNKLGVPSAKDVDALIARIDELNRNVQKLSGKAPVEKAEKPAAKKAAPARKAAAPKAAVAAPAEEAPVEAAKPVAKKRAAAKRPAAAAPAAPAPAADAA